MSETARKEDRDADRMHHEAERYIPIQRF